MSLLLLHSHRYYRMRYPKITRYDWPLSCQICIWIGDGIDMMAGQRWWLLSLRNRASNVNFPLGQTSGLRAPPKNQISRVTENISNLLVYVILWVTRSNNWASRWRWEESKVVGWENEKLLAYIWSADDLYIIKFSCLEEPHWNWKAASVKGGLGDRWARKRNGRKLVCQRCTRVVRSRVPEVKLWVNRLLGWQRPSCGRVVRADDKWVARVVTAQESGLRPDIWSGMQSAWWVASVLDHSVPKLEARSL